MPTLLSTPDTNDSLTSEKFDYNSPQNESTDHLKVCRLNMADGVSNDVSNSCNTFNKCGRDFNNSVCETDNQNNITCNGQKKSSLSMTSVLRKPRQISPDKNSFNITIFNLRPGESLKNLPIPGSEVPSPSVTKHPGTTRCLQHRLVHEFNPSVTTVVITMTV